MKCCNFFLRLDGDEKRHNTIRNINGKPTFRRIMDNISLLCENNDDVKIVIKLNYDDKKMTITDIGKILEQIPQQYRKYISFEFKRAWQSSLEVSESAKTNKKLHGLYESVDSMGFIHSHSSSSFQCGKNVRCYADRFYHTVINHNGKISKCRWHLEREVGDLQEDGAINWHQEAMNKMYAKATFENDKCLSCKHLPICLGTCSQNQYDKPDDIPCELDASENAPEQFIIDHYNRKMNSLIK